jgi:hypothetical protein
MDRARRVLLLGTPLVAAATVAIGLRVGAPRAIRAASVYAAPLAADGRRAAWQIVTYVDDRSVREAIAMRGLRVVARVGDRSAAWSGDSNADGVAEASLDVAPQPGQEVVLEVREGEHLLAGGRFTFRPPAWTAGDDARAWVRPTRREGTVQLDAAVRGERLPAGFAGSVWVRAADATTGAPLDGVVVTVAPELGLEVDGTPAPTCKTGWTEVRATPMGHVVGMTLRARAPSGATGEWFGGLPVAGGADQVDLPLAVSAGTPWSVQLLSLGARGVAYVEVVDGRGRAFATTLTLPRGGAFAGARVEIPPLEPGLKWLVTAGDPRGAETLTGAAVARPFLVSAGPAGEDRCALADKVATRVGGRSPRWLALDGVDRSPERRRRQLGLSVAVASLAVAALLEALLLVQGARRARDAIERAVAEHGEGTAEVARRPPAGGVVVGVLVALLGFALLAALLLWKG